MIRSSPTLIFVLLSCLQIVAGRTCELDGPHLTCSQICYSESFTTCPVVCSYCSFSTFDRSIVECIGSMGCTYNKFYRSYVKCVNCGYEEFHYSAVECTTSASCPTISVRTIFFPGSCCDGVGCPSKVPSCQTDLQNFCFQRTLGKTYKELGNPACINIEEASSVSVQPVPPTPTPQRTQPPSSHPTTSLTARPTSELVVTAQPVPRPPVVPTQQPVASPTEPPATESHFVDRMFDAVAFKFEHVPGPLSSLVLANLEVATEQWMMDYYNSRSIPENDVQEFRLVARALSQSTNGNITTVLFSQRMRFSAPENHQALSNPEVVFTEPFWDREANDGFCSSLSSSFPEFSTLKSPMDIPVFLDSTSEGVISTPRETEDEETPAQTVSMATFIGALVGSLVGMSLLITAVGYTMYRRCQPTPGMTVKPPPGDAEDGLSRTRVSNEPTQTLDASRTRVSDEPTQTVDVSLSTESNSISHFLSAAVPTAPPEANVLKILSGPGADAAALPYKQQVRGSIVTANLPVAQTMQE